jgi:hypothetical protein
MDLLELPKSDNIIWQILNANIFVITLSGILLFNTFIFFG